MAGIDGHRVWDTVPVLRQLVSPLAGVERKRDRLRPLVPELFHVGGHSFMAERIEGEVQSNAGGAELSVGER